MTAGSIRTATWFLLPASIKPCRDYRYIRIGSWTGPFPLPKRTAVSPRRARRPVRRGDRALKARGPHRSLRRQANDTRIIARSLLFKRLPSRWSIAHPGPSRGRERRRSHDTCRLDPERSRSGRKPSSTHGRWVNGPLCRPASEARVALFNRHDTYRIATCRTVSSGGMAVPD